MSGDTKLERLAITEKKIVIARNLILLIILGCIVTGGLGVGGYYGFKAYNRHENKVKAEATKKKQEDQIKNLGKALVAPKSVGETAVFQNLSITLLESRKLASIPADKIGSDTTALMRAFAKPARDVYALHFQIHNSSSDEQNWDRQVGWIVTFDNLHDNLDSYPFNTEYLSKVGEIYTKQNQRIYVQAGQEKSTWVVIEVASSLTNPVFVAPGGSGLNGYWLIK